MKKLLVLMSLFSTVSLFAGCPDCDNRYDRYDNNYYYSESQPTVDCATECRKGRFVSSEAARQCNNCQGWGDDESTAEAKDFPS